MSLKSYWIRFGCIKRPRPGVPFFFITGIDHHHEMNGNLFLSRFFIHPTRRHCCSSLVFRISPGIRGILCDSSELNFLDFTRNLPLLFCLASFLLGRLTASSPNNGESVAYQAIKKTFHCDWDCTPTRSLVAGVFDVLPCPESVGWLRRVSSVTGALHRLLHHQVRVQVIGRRKRTDDVDFSTLKICWVDAWTGKFVSYWTFSAIF